MTLRILHSGRAALAAVCLLAPALAAAPPARAQAHARAAMGAPVQLDVVSFVRLAAASTASSPAEVFAPRPEPPPPPRNPLDFFFRWLMERWRRFFA